MNTITQIEDAQEYRSSLPLVLPEPDRSHADCSAEDAFDWDQLKSLYKNGNAEART